MAGADGRGTWNWISVIMGSSRWDGGALPTAEARSIVEAPACDRHEGGTDVGVTSSVEIG